MPMQKTVLAAFAAALFAFAPASARTHHAHARAPSAKYVTPAMFTVHGPKGTAYLFGSIHVLPPDINWKYPALMDAMKRSDTFVFEVPLDHWDQDKATAANIQKEVMDLHGLLPPGESLRHELSEDMVPRYDETLAELGISPSYVDRLQPWLAAMVLETAEFHSDARAMNGVDVNVFAIAQSMHKQTRGLETLQDQLAIIGTQEQQYGMDQLTNTLQGTGSDPSQKFDKILAAWERGDVDAIARDTAEELGRHPEQQKQMLDDRNTRWVAELKTMLDQPRVYFITVGAAHLAGSSGVPAQMRAAGYRVDGPSELRPSPTPALDKIVNKLSAKPMPAVDARKPKH